MNHQKMIIVYDNWCPNCTRFARIVKMLDWFNLLHPLPLRNLPRDVKPDEVKAKKAMAGYFNNRWNYGYPTIYHILLRLPMVWMLVPLLWLMAITGLGKIIYDALAVRRNIIPLYCEDSCGL